MLMKTKLFVIIWMIASLFFAGPSFSEEKAKAAKEMSREEILEKLKHALDSEKAVLNYIPELKELKDEGGKEYYTFSGVKLEDLDKEKLRKLRIRVNQIRTQIRTERLNKQLESIQQAQRAAVIAQQASRISTVSAHPQQAPPTPPTAQQIPKAPPPPPTPPRR